MVPSGVLWTIDIYRKVISMSEWPPVVNPILTTATPISRWMVGCTYRTTSLTLPRPPSMLSKVWRRLPTRPVLALLASIHDVLRPCVTSWFHAPCEWRRAASRAVARMCRRNRGVPWYTAGLWSVKFLAFLEIETQGIYGMIWCSCLD